VRIRVGIGFHHGSKDLAPLVGHLGSGPSACLYKGAQSRIDVRLQLRLLVLPGLIPFSE